MRLIVLCLELGLIWLVYYLLAVATSYQLPLWLTAIMIVCVDRIVSRISHIATRRRQRLRQDA